MSTIAFVSPPLQGHLNPMLVLGAELKTRGHRVVFFAQVDAAPYIQKHGLDFCAVGTRTHPTGSLATTVKAIASVSGLWGLGAVIRDMARTTDMLATELPDQFRNNGIDTVVCDQLEAAGGLVAEHLRLPCVSIANALPINRDPAVPPYFSHWPPSGDAWAARRNQGAEDVSDLMMRAHATVIRRHAQAFGLPPRSTCADCLSPDLQISQIVSGFDFPRVNRPGNFHYTGPIRGTESGTLPDLPQNRPLVFASLGTLFGHRVDIFEKIADACRRLGAGLVIAHGGKLDRTQIARLSETATVTDFVPQRALLAKVDACVTHAGMNTMMDALSLGVPAVALPFAFDQPGIAARLEWSGAGIRLHPRRASTSKIQRALAQVLEQPSYRSKARVLADEIQNAGGVTRVAGLIEQLAVRSRE